MALRDHALGRLATTFQAMAREAERREASLRRQLSKLRIELDTARQQRRE